MNLYQMNYLNLPMLNGNPMVEAEHVFIKGDGCYYPTKEIAYRIGVGPNASGVWGKTITAFGKTWFQAGQDNVWD